MKVYEMQVKVQDRDAHGNNVLVWKSVKATRSSTPYQYGSYLEARKMLDTCYPMPLENERKRVVSIDTNGIETVETHQNNH